MGKLEACWQVSFAMWNELMAVYSWAVDGDKNFSKYFANLWVGVPIAERIELKGSSPVQVFFWILPNSYKMVYNLLVLYIFK